ncbi:MAG: DNA polymerase III subunit gamma/tau [Bacteroidia bacterium]|nr:DNA polymerase III subunit gamma/tau [Bacteroidia bacterium]
MDNFIVSARKYRPNTFVSLVGQDSIATTLKNSIKREQLAHAYLFCGPRGVGKTSTARIFAKTINCENPGENLEPCGECESCKSFAQGRSYCIHELDAASNNSVDDIRLLTEKVMIPPQIGKYSVYIIDEVHMLSSAAFNAFLKTLEEPPAHAIFILATTEKHKILPTILSRCQTYDFNRISIEDIVKNLSSIAKQESVTIDSDSLHVIAQKADGAMRDALTLFDQTVAFCGSNVTYADVIKNLNVLDYDYYFNMVECALGGSHSKALLLFDDILSKGFNALYFISGLSSHLRNLMVCKDASTFRLLEMAPSMVEKYKMQSAKCSFNFLYKALAQTTKCESEYKSSGNQRLLVEFLLVTLVQIAQPVSSVESVQNQSAPTEQKPVQQPVVQVEQKSATPAATGAAVSEVKQSETEQEQPADKHKTESVQEQPVAQKKNEAEQKRETVVNNALGGLSIKGMLKKVKSAPEQEKDTLVTQSNTFTMEELGAAWKKMASAQVKYPRLSSAILAVEPILQEDGSTIVFMVGNSAQQDWIIKNTLPSLIGFLQKELNNKDITLKVEVLPTAQQKKVPYTEREKAAVMLKDNPALADLAKQLDLDI